MSLKSNILACYASQIYVTLAGILMLPLYLKYMGAEAYGLVGFFSMLQSLFTLLDLGLSPTVARETSRFFGGALDLLIYRQLFRALQMLFSVIALIGGSVIIFFAGDIATHWLNVKSLHLFDVKISVQLMAICASLRWISGLYRGTITGAERLVWLGGFNAFIATLRFLGVIPVLITIGATPVVFFLYQLVVAAVELVGLYIKNYKLLPQMETKEKQSFSFAPIKPLLRFSLTIAFTSSVWVLVTQTDKLVLSKLLPLSDFGYFSLAVLVASGVTMISGPISTVLLPRLVRLQAENEEEALIQLYRLATQCVAVIAIPASLILAFFAKEVLWAWTGSNIVAEHAAPALRLYALGNGILALSAFPYYLQFAKGDLKLHLAGNVLFVLILIPSLIFLTIRYGMVGAGYAWLGANVIYFLLWVPLVHNKFVRGLHWNWIRYDLAVPLLLGCAIATFLDVVAQWPIGRAQTLFQLVLFGFLLLFICTFTMEKMRQGVLRIFHFK